VREYPELRETILDLHRRSLTHQQILEYWSKNWILDQKISSLPSEMPSSEKVKRTADWILGLCKEGKGYHKDPANLRGPEIYRVVAAADLRADMDLSMLWRQSLHCSLREKLSQHPEQYPGIVLPSETESAPKIQEWMSHPANAPLLNSVKNLTFWHISRSIPAERRLVILPKEISLLKNLQSLCIFGSGLEIIPSSLQNLTKLKDLKLTECFFSKIPEPIWHLTNLETLIIAESNVEEVSERLGNLTKLNCLKLWRNRIRKLPDSIGNLSSLTDLDVSRNQLATLPASFERIQFNLRRVHFDWNRFGFQVPEAVRDKKPELFHRVMDSCAIQ
jgi:Leucine-rich repeat (LRR) protein